MINFMNRPSKSATGWGRELNALHTPEGDEVSVAEGRDEEGEDEFPNLRASIQIPPPDLRQQRLPREYRNIVRFIFITSQVHCYQQLILV